MLKGDAAQGKSKSNMIPMSPDMPARVHSSSMHREALESCSVRQGSLQGCSCMRKASWIKGDSSLSCGFQDARACVLKGLHHLG